ncbi:MAG: TonB-dependent receptor [Gammaproteobacteria bacterium]
MTAERLVCFMNRSAIVVTLSLVVGITPGMAAADLASKVHFDISAQPLPSALLKYSDQAGVQIASTAEIIEDKATPGVVGTLVARNALEQLLSGTGLVYEVIDASTVAIHPATATRSAPEQRQTVPSPAPASKSNGKESFWSRFRLAQADDGEAPPEPKQKDESGAPKKAAPVEEVVVTGTHIRGSNTEASNLTSVTREDFERAGFQDVGQALRAIPENFGGGVNPETNVANIQVGGANHNASGISSANLLGLGSGATLTLLNGERLPAVAEGLAVDLDLVPVAAIERVDVLTNGASAIYGTDAVAGVVNIVTRRSYDGVEARARYGGAEGGSDTYRGSVLAGGQADNLSGVVAVEYTNRGRLGAGDRERSQSLEAPFDLVGNSNKVSAYAAGQYDLGSRLSLSADAVYMRRAEDSYYTYYGTTSYYAPTISEYAASSELSAKLADTWTLSAYGSLRGNTNDVLAYDDVSQSTSRSNRHNYLRSLELRASGDLFSLPGGAPQLAAGAAFRKEGMTSGTNSKAESDRTVGSLYAEVSVPIVGPNNRVPLVEDLRLTLADRLDHYSDVGSVSVPKVGLSWDLNRSFAATASYSRSFRAPSPFDRADSYFSVIVGGVADNTPTGKSTTLYLGGTGASLTPERSKNVNVGLTYTPEWLEGFKVGLSYYGIDYTNRIAGPDPSQIFAFDIRNAPAELITRAPTQAALNAIVADAYSSYALSSPYDLSLVSAVVDMRNTNISSTHIDGMQVSPAYRIDLTRGVLDLRTDFSYIGHFTDRVRAGVAEATRVGTIFNPPRFRTRLSAQWTAPQWGASLFWNYVDSYTDDRVAGAPLGVASWITFDASVYLDFGAESRRDLRILLGATNLLDRKPPFITSTGNYYSAANWDATNASIVGRFTSLEVIKRW